MITELQDGKHTECWMDSEDKEMVFLDIHCNGVTLALPAKCFIEMAEEMNEAAKSFILHVKRN